MGDDDPTVEFPADTAGAPGDTTTWYSPTAPAPGPYPYPPAPPPPRPRAHGCLIGGLIAVGAVLVLGAGCVAVLAVAVDDVEDDRAAEDRREARDVVLEDCHASALGTMAATVQVTNHSSERSNYLINVVFESPNGRQQLGTAPVIVNALGPDQVAEREAVTGVRATGEFDCHVGNVERFSDETSS